MVSLTALGINKSRLTVLIMMGLLVQGLLIYAGIPKRENPAITIRNAQITAQFPGMSPERMEDLIVEPIERKAREIGEIEDINTLITTGSTVITLTAYDNVSGADLTNMFQDVRNRMEVSVVI